MTTIKQLENSVIELQKTMRSLIIVVVVLFLLTAGYVGYKEFYGTKAVNAVGAAQDQPQQPQEQFGLIKDYPKMNKDDHVRGNRNATLLLIEYADLECPFCKQFHETVQQFLNDNKDAALVYRHYPLSQIHSKATDEAIASECVAQLGGDEAFWKFIDGLFAITPSNDGLDLAQLPGLALAAGVDQGAFEACFSQKSTKKIVEDHYQSGLSFGVRGTPNSFLINTKNGKAVSIPGALPYEAFKQALKKIE